MYMNMVLCSCTAARGDRVVAPHHRAVAAVHVLYVDGRVAAPREHEGREEGLVAPDEPVGVEPLAPDAQHALVDLRERDSNVRPSMRLGSGLKGRGLESHLRTNERLRSAALTAFSRLRASALGTSPWPSGAPVSSVKAAAMLGGRRGPSDFSPPPSRESKLAVVATSRPGGLGGVS